MFTEIVRFDMPEAMSREEALALFRDSAEGWRRNPDLIRKSYLLDMERRVAGGVYLWRRREDAERWHGPEFRARVRAGFGSDPVSEVFETPLLVEAPAGEIIET